MDRKLAILLILALLTSPAYAFGPMAATMGGKGTTIHQQVTNFEGQTASPWTGAGMGGTASTDVPSGGGTYSWKLTLADYGTYAQISQSGLATKAGYLDFWYKYTSSLSSNLKISVTGEPDVYIPAQSGWTHSTSDVPIPQTSNTSITIKVESGYGGATVYLDNINILLQ